MSNYIPSEHCFCRYLRVYCVDMTYNASYNNCCDHFKNRNLQHKNVTCLGYGLHQSHGNFFQRRTFLFVWDLEVSVASATATLD